MISRIAFVLFFFMSALQAFAGEKPSIHLTGNPSIDFFSGDHKVSMAKAFDDDSIPPTQLLSPDRSKKSPWVAGLLSLAVPGAGEIYTENYFKGAIFLAVEAASWITAYTYDKKGDRQTDYFQDYANAHWSAARYARWLRDNPDFQLPDNIKANLFYSNDDCGPPFPCVNWRELDTAKDYIDQHFQNSGFTHSLPYWGQQQYYELIGKYYQFSKGWDSQEGDLSDYHNGNPQFDTYREAFNQADKYYDVAVAFVSVAIANHILSAIDAAWSATRYNNDLHAEVQMRMIPSRYGFITMTEQNVKFTF